MKVQKNALLLISGGFDSPVAGKLAQEKGYLLKAIHFSQEPFTDNSAEKKALQLCKLLGIKEMITIDAGEMLKEITDKTYREYYFILMKRFFMKVSERIAELEDCEFLVTGESIGQVSSQTISNLNNINNATKIEILRPLIFMKKQDIIDLSKKFGFYETCIGKELCDALATGKPKTHSKTRKVLEEENKCEMEKLVKRALEKVRKEKTENTNLEKEKTQGKSICKR